MLMSGLLVWGMNMVPMHGRLFRVIGKPHPVLSWSVIAVVIAILGLIGFFAGLLPALQAAKVDPAEALVYE